MKRTDQQNRALHLYFRLLAEALNDAGYDMKRTLKEDIDIPWTEEMVKRHLWKPIQEAMTHKESTTELNRVEPGDIYAVLDRHLAEKLGVSVPWPEEKDD